MFLKIIFPAYCFFNFWSGLFFPEILIVGAKKEFSDSLKNIDKKFMPLIKEEDVVIVHSAYTICYNEKHEQANWVVYRLSAEMCGNKEEERSNNFREDPEVKSRSATPEDYKKSGYDRGHLCPAGDMGWSKQTMSESFFMSNMSPQVPGFNRGIWKNLEGEVRKWAKQNETIYVVTAGILEEGLDKIGDGVSVPKYYYKVILDVHPPEYKAIAFVLPNKASKDPVLNYAVSIDSVEHLTGLDFFHALPDSLECYLEANFNPDQWKIIKQ